MSQVLLNQSIPYFTVNTKTLFIPLRNIYMECFALIQGEPKLHPLICLRDTCHRNQRCIEVLSKRVLYWFEKVEPQAELMVMYFQHQEPKFLGAGIFSKNLDDPYVVKFHVSALDKLKQLGLVKFWTPTDEYKNLDNTIKLPAIIPAENLIRK